MRMRLFRVDDLKTAVRSLRCRPWRSFVTMLGIIISIISVVSVVSIGEGIKRQVAVQMNHLGRDLITIRPGNVAFNDDNITKSLSTVVGPTNSSLLNVQDLQVIRTTPQVGIAVPLGVVPGTVQPDGVKSKAASDVVVIATQNELTRALNQKVAYGEFLDPEDYGKNVAVIGANVATSLFRADVPLGETFTFRGQQFIVQGVMESQDIPPLAQNTDFNNAIFISLQTAEQLKYKNAPLYEILVKPNKAASVDTVARSITERLRVAHGNVQDFTVLKPDQNVAISGRILDLLTRLIAGVAAISLFVGGVGIMNIMWLLVTERTREIGIRKAIGATNRQILSQFLAEVVTLSVFGSLFGVIGAAIVNILLRILTDLQPVWPWTTTALATGVAIVVGVIFGMAPAIKAARKEPIEALRNE